MQAASLVGTDLVHIPSFAEKVKQRGDLFLHKVFSAAELNDAQGDIASLAGKFAGKEAFIKTLNQQAYQLKDIQVLKQDNKPYILFVGKPYFNISVTHEHDYAMAVVIRQEPAHETA